MSAAPSGTTFRSSSSVASIQRISESRLSDSQSGSTVCAAVMPRALAAQKEPDKYRNLIVRIAGYSAYFVDLSPAQQSEIISRTQEQVG